jgi:hypothetical protein
MGYFEIGTHNLIRIVSTSKTLFPLSVLTHS